MPLSGMQVPGFLVVVALLGGLLWSSYFHVSWYGSRLELTGGYACTDQVTDARLSCRTSD